MQHLDPELLALLALGEHPRSTATDSDRSHLEVCVACQADLSAFTVVAQSARAVTEADVLTSPDPVVWERIRSELGLRLVAPDAADTTPRRRDREEDLSEDGPTLADQAPSLSGRGTRPRRLLPWLSLAAAVALVGGVAVGVQWERREVSTPEVTLASARLDALPAWPDASGSARLEEAASGRRQVVVQLDAPATPGAYREVWLIADDLSGLVSLGVLEGAEGRFDIPTGLDVARFSLVDVSEESLDGIPGHSGNSIVRGALVL